MATLYDSRYAARKQISNAPVTIAVNQNVQRHPLASERKPPTVGPRTGAMNGVIPMTVSARPRCSGLNISPTMDELSVVEATVNPRRKRKAISMSILRLSAAATEKRTNRMLAM